MQRFEYIDIAKGIGILLVVWAHIMLSGISHRIIYAFHMPLFFLISGMLFRREKYPNFWIFIRRRSKRLLVPFVIYSVVTWLIWALFRFIRHDDVVSYWDPLLQTIIAKGSGAYMVHNSALWFIPCLLATEILYFFIGKYRVVTRLFLSCCCASLSFVLGYFFNDEWWFLLPWNFDASLIAVLFYCVGNVFSTYISGTSLLSYCKTHSVIVGVLLILLSAILFVSSMEFGECSMGSSSYQCNGFVFIIRALVGCAACLIISISLSFLSKENIIKRYLSREGSDSLDIMSIHIPIKGVVIIFLSLILHISSDLIESTFLYSLISFLITMLIVDSLVYVIRRGKNSYNISING